MRQAAQLALAVFAVLQVCLLGSCTPPSAIIAEVESPDWRHAVETEHYVIHTNVSRELVERAAVVAERAYAGASRRLRVNDDNPAFAKTIERTFDQMPWELTNTWDDGSKLYELPDGLKLTEWPGDNTVREIVFPDGRKYAFWEHAMYGRKVAVYLCATQEELNTWFADGGDAKRGGWGPATGVVGIMAVSENQNDDLDNLAHEIGHQCMGYVVYGPPVWLDEGLALYAGVGRADREVRDDTYRSGVIRQPMLKTCAKAVEDGALVPVAELVKMDFAAFHMDTDNEWQHYAQSWALVHCLMESKHPRIRGKLRAYLDELKKGRDAIEALDELYDPDVLQEEYVNYIKALAEREQAKGQRRTRAQRTSLLLPVVPAARTLAA
jgi:hypothetical protein